MSKTVTKDLLLEDINSLFWKLSIPSVLGLIAASAYQFVDAMFIGRWVGVYALSTVSLSYMLVLIINGIGSMIGTGSSSVLSRAIGKNDVNTQNGVYSTLLFISVCLSIAIIPVLLIIVKPFMEIMSSENAIAVLGVHYIQIIAVGIPFSILSCAISMAIRAEGRVLTSVMILGAGSILNIILDPIFIKVLDLGLDGAAIATVISQFVSFAFCIAWLYKTKRIKRVKPNKSLVLSIMRIGVSGILLNLMTLIQLSFVYGIIGKYGDDRNIVILGTCMTFLNMAFVPIWGISQALQPVIGINYGANKLERVRNAFRVFAARSTIISAILWIIMELFPHQLLSWFIKDYTLINYGIVAFRIIFGMFISYGFFIAMITMFQSTGRVKNAFVLMFGRMLAVFLPVLLICSTVFGINGIWMTFPITDAIILIFGVILYSSFKRKHLV